MTSRVGERGQVTIEKAIREELGVYAGDQAIQRIEDGRVVIEFVPAPHRRSLAGLLRDKVTKHPPNEDWPSLREAAESAPDPDRRNVISVDTSVVVRYLVGTPPAQARRAAALIDATTEVGVPLVALVETAHVLRTQYGVERADVLEALIELLTRENFILLGLPKGEALAALVRARSVPGSPIADALIVASAKASSALPLYSFDKDMARHGVTVAVP